MVTKLLEMGEKSGPSIQNPISYEDVDLALLHSLNEETFLQKATQAEIKELLGRLLDVAVTSAVAYASGNGIYIHENRIMPLVKIPTELETVASFLSFKLEPESIFATKTLLELLKNYPFRATVNQLDCDISDLTLHSVRLGLSKDTSRAGLHAILNKDKNGSAIALVETTNWPATLFDVNTSAKFGTDPTYTLNSKLDAVKHPISVTQNGQEIRMSPVHDKRQAIYPFPEFAASAKFISSKCLSL